MTGVQTCALPISLGEDTAIPSITTSATRIDELMTLLVDNRVGPAGLSDVIADWL